MKRFGPMFRKEFIQMRRDRLTLGIMIGIPVIQLLLFGFAIQTDVRHIPTVVLDESRTPTSRELIAAFQNTGNFRIVAYVDGRDALDGWIARGDAQAAIAIPHDFPRDLARGTTATIQVIVDASDPLSSQAALASAAGIAQVRNLAVLSAAAHRRELPLEARIRPRYNPGLRSANYIVPGLVGVILTITMVLVTAMAIVRERERGTLEQLIVTPITKTELMLGKISPYVGVGLVQMTTVLLLGRFVFDVPSCSSPPAWPWGCSSRPSCARSSRRCRPASSSCCRTSSCPDSCSHGRRCRWYSSGSARSCRSRISSRCCGASC